MNNNISKSEISVIENTMQEASSGHSLTFNITKQKWNNITIIKLNDV